jgi:hypothetical protein
MSAEFFSSVSADKAVAGKDLPARAALPFCRVLGRRCLKDRNDPTSLPNTCGSGWCTLTLQPG